MDDFNADYYSAVAQVIPTLFIAAIATRYFARRDKAESLFSSLLLLAVVTVVVFGETFALEALNKREAVADSTDEIITFAFMGPLLMIAAELSGAPTRAVVRQLSKRQLAVLGWGVVVLGVVLTTLVALQELDTFNQVLSGAILGFLVLVAIAYLIHTRPKRDDGSG